MKDCQEQVFGQPHHPLSLILWMDFTSSVVRGKSYYPYDVNSYRFQIGKLMSINGFVVGLLISINVPEYMCDSYCNGSYHSSYCHIM